MSNNKQSSVEWLVEQLEKYYVKTDLKNTVVYQQAKAMHKDEIVDAVEYGCSDWGSAKDAEQYYNETLKKNEQQ